MTTAAENYRGIARRYPRRYIRGRAITHFAGRSTYGQVIQIGEGGMLLATTHDVNVGQVIVVQFALPNAKLQLRCEVLYLVPTPSTVRGVCAGVQFIGASELERAVIRAFVTKGMPIQIKRRKLK